MQTAVVNNNVDKYNPHYLAVSEDFAIFTRHTAYGTTNPLLILTHPDIFLAHPDIFLAHRDIFLIRPDIFLTQSEQTITQNG